MSSHFNYEIEERNMRKQLKELEVSYKEEAWQNYEAYAKQFYSAHKTPLLPNFNFALNRSVILPVVFGGIIILFSFLLFNFINIKNPAKKEISEIKTPAINPPVEKPKPIVKKTVIIPAKKEEIKTSTNITTVTAVPAQTMAAVVKLQPEQNNTKEIVADSKTLSQNTSANSISVTAQPKKKRRKKGKAEVLESIATPISLPTVTQEEAEPELR